MKAPAWRKGKIVVAKSTINWLVNNGRGDWLRYSNDDWIAVRAYVEDAPTVASARQRRAAIEASDAMGGEDAVRNLVRGWT